MGLPSDFPARLSEVRRRIDAACRRAGRDSSAVTLVAVTKSLSRQELGDLATSGLTDIGENRVLEGLARRRLFRAPARWHMVGRLQTNKVKKALEWVDVLHSLDRPSLVAELEIQLARSDRRLPCYVQVNVSGEKTKGGYDPREIPEALAQIRAEAPHLQILGLMTMAPEFGDPRPHFRRLRASAEECGLPGLSMGMTNDFETALEEGATCIRLGSALFAPGGFP